MAEALLDRDVEMDQLAAAARDARDGRGRLVVLEGSAGAGKSALLAAASAAARDDGLHVLGARGGLLERDFPFGLARQLFEDVLERAPTGERERLLAGAARPAGAAMALDGESPPAANEPSLLHAFYWLTSTVAARSPVVLCVDDAHWGDESSLRVLSYLARRLEDLPVALLVALRPAEPGVPAELLDELTVAPGVARLTLRPLGPDATAALVRRHRPDADDAFCAACHTACAGNPFYLDELLRAVESRDGDGDGAAAVHGAAAASLGDRVGRRVARIGPEARTLAEAMAVLPDGSRLATAAALADLDAEAAGALAHRLRRIDVLAQEDPFAFAHPLVRASLYDALPAAARDAAHLAAGRLLSEAGAPDAAVAAQMAARTPGGSAEAAAALVRAAERALERAAPREAIHLLRRALAEDAPEPPHGPLLAMLGLAEMGVRDPAAAEDLRRAYDLGTDPVQRAQVAVLLGVEHFLAGRGPESLEVLAEARSALVGTRDREALAELEAVVLMVATYVRGGGMPDRARIAELEPLTAGDSWGSRALAALLAAMAAHSGLEAARVTALLDRALDGPVLYDLLRHDAWAISHALIALIEVDELDRAIEVCGEVEAEARRVGSVLGRLTTEAHHAWALARAGDLPGAEAYLRAGLASTDTHADPIALASQLFFSTDAIVERESLDDVAAFVEGLDLTLYAGMVMETMVRTLRGRLRLAGRDAAGAVEDLRVARDVAVATGMGPRVVPSRSLLALALPAGDRDEALALVGEELELARAAGLPRAEGIALRAGGLLRGGAEGIALLEASVAALAPSPARLEHARSLVALGGALRRARRRTAAREPLAAGLELAHACGATRLTARAREELQAAGGRPRRIARTGRDALTASEQRIARLASGGASNPEIAQELFLSLKTVETHLTSVYRKLGLAGHGSRERLAEALATETP